MACRSTCIAPEPALVALPLPLSLEGPAGAVNKHNNMIFEHGYNKPCSMAMAGVSTSIESSSKVWGPPLDLTFNGPATPVIQHMHIPLGDVKTWHTMGSGHRCRWWPSLCWHANHDCRVNDISSMISVAVHQKWLRTVCGGVWCSCCTALLCFWPLAGGAVEYGEDVHEKYVWMTYALCS